MRRVALLGLTAVCLCAALALFGWRVWSAPTVLRVAVGPASSEDANLAAAAAQYLAREHDGLRLVVVPAETEVESARLLDEGRADLAVVRTDAGIPEKAQTVAVMHRDSAVLLAPSGRGIASVADLRGRGIGLFRARTANAALLGAVLSHYEVPAGDVRPVLFATADDLAAALRAGTVDAVLAVGTPTGRTVADAVLTATAAGDGGAPVFVPIHEADAIAQRTAVYSALDIVRGAFGGASPRPPEPVRTLGVDHRLVAAATLDDSVVSELTRLLFVMRPSLAATVPIANRIEAPDVSPGSGLPVHPGALAYYNNEVETFFDRYSDAVYIGAMVLSVVVSAGAGLVSRAGAQRRERTIGLLGRILAIVQAARSAPGTAELDALEREADEILGVALSQAGAGRLHETGVSAFTLGLEQVRHAIADRRRVLEATGGAIRFAGRPQAAE